LGQIAPCLKIIQNDDSMKKSSWKMKYNVLKARPKLAGKMKGDFYHGKIYIGDPNQGLDGEREGGRGD
jgi:hypothetical protein